MKVKLNINKKRQMLVIVVCLFFMAGIITGSLFAGGPMGEKIINAIPEGGLNRSGASFLPLSEAFSKNMFLNAAIWCCGFFSFGIILAAGLVFLKAVSYGYAVSVVMRANGIGFAAAAFLPQALIIVPVYILTACAAISYINERSFNKIPQRRLKREKNRMRTEYIIIFLASVIFIFAASIIESLIVPAFIS